jgi:hypothetical protein
MRPDIPDTIGLAWGRPTSGTPLDIEPRERPARSGCSVGIMANRKRKKRKTARGRRSSKEPARRKKSSTKKRGTRRARSSPRKKSPSRKRARIAARSGSTRKSPRAGAGRPRRSGVREASGRGIGAESAGQSGDTEQISRAEIADSESVEELLEEGQAFEAGVISGVESAPDADRGEVRTRQVPEDDVPQEYLDED